MSDSIQSSHVDSRRDARHADVMQPQDELIQRTLDVDAIMQRVRQELARRGVAVDGGDPMTPTVTGALWSPIAQRLPERDHFVVAELLPFDDEDFIEIAYRTLLKRPANDSGSRDYLAALRSGAMSKIEILGSIRFSDEGSRHCVHVDGLLLPYKLHRLRRLPIVGWMLGVGIALVRLPRLARRLQAIEAAAAHESQALGRWVNQLDAAVARRLQHVENQIQAMRNEIVKAHEDLARIVGDQAALDAKLLESDAGHREVWTKVNEQLRGDQRRLLAMLERLTVFLDGATRQQNDRGAQISVSQLQSMEQQYASFEETFRGDREQVKLRVAHYLEVLAAAGVKPESDELIIDLGSGRGEWLEVLTEHGYRGRGVDLNRSMLKQSELRGHDIVEADVLNYLKTQDADSAAAITSMHLVEHLPNAILIQLLDEALRVLQPGGILILETPNPENVLVGSCTFYLDPTHLNPIPPGLLQWTVKSRGFEDARIDRLSEHRGQPTLTPVPDGIPGAAQVNQMITWFTAPPDYAVIARKPAAARPLSK